MYDIYVQGSPAVKRYARPNDDTITIYFDDVASSATSRVYDVYKSTNGISWTKVSSSMLGKSKARMAGTSVLQEYSLTINDYGDHAAYFRLVAVDARDSQKSTEPLPFSDDSVQYTVMTPEYITEPKQSESFSGAGGGGGGGCLLR